MDLDTETASLANTMVESHLTDASKSNPKKKTGSRRKNHRGGKKKAPSSVPTNLTTSSTAGHNIPSPNDSNSSSTNTNTNTNTPLFAIKPTPHADLGLIATAPIPRGTRILTEPALLSLRPSATSPHAIHAAFLALPPTAQATILALDAVEDADSWPLRARIAELAKRREEQDSAALEREFVAALERFKVVSVVRTNAFNMRETRYGEGVGGMVEDGEAEGDAEADGDGPGDAGADGEPYVGVFPTASRLNHSCLPNTYITFNRGLGQLAVHATCDILPGEELTCTYLGAVSFYMSREWRQDGLRRWGFQCKCAACGDGEDGERHERRRERLQKNQFRAQKFKRGEGDMTMALGWALELVVGLEEERAGKEVARARRAAASLCHALGRNKAAVLHAQKGLYVAQCCLGSDDPEFADYQQFAQRLKDEVKGNERK